MSVSNQRAAVDRMNQRYEKIAEIRNDTKIPVADRAAAIKMLNVQVAELATQHRGFFNEAGASNGVNFDKVIDRGNHIQHTNIVIGNDKFLEQSAIDNVKEHQAVKDMAASNDIKLSEHVNAANSKAAASNSARAASVPLTAAEQAERLQQSMNTAKNQQSHIIAENNALQQTASAEKLAAQIHNVNPNNSAAKLASLQDSVNTAVDAQARGAHPLAQKFYVNQIGENFNQLPEAVIEKFSSTPSGGQAADMARTFADARAENRHIPRSCANPGKENLEAQGVKEQKAAAELPQAKEWADKTRSDVEQNESTRMELADRQNAIDRVNNEKFEASVREVRAHGPAHREAKGDAKAQICANQKTARDMGRVFENNEKSVQEQRQSNQEKAEQSKGVEQPNHREILQQHPSNIKIKQIGAEKQNQNSNRGQIGKQVANKPIARSLSSNNSNNSHNDGKTRWYTSSRNNQQSTQKQASNTSSIGSNKQSENATSQRGSSYSPASQNTANKLAAKVSSTRSAGSATSPRSAYTARSASTAPTSRSASSPATPRSASSSTRSTASRSAGSSASSSVGRSASSSGTSAGQSR